MTLAQRISIAITILTVVTTAALGFGVREAWRRAEEERFRQTFVGAVLRMDAELGRQAEELPALVAPLCNAEPLVDSALVDLRAGELSSARRLSIAERVPLLMKGLSLDELTVATATGEILGAGDKAIVGRVDRKVAERASNGSAPVRVRTTTPAAIEAHCVRREGGHAIVVVAARRAEALLRRLGESQGLSVSLGEGTPLEGEISQSARLSQLGGLSMVATQSRVPLHAALRELDVTILSIGTGVFLLSLLLAILMSRGLARPIVRMSAQAREVVAGEPKPVEATGGRELAEFADSFNRAIADLTALRKRLAITERIAARREIARQVAHEIKNPLAPIRASVETLRRLRARDDPAFDGYFDEATRTVLDEVRRIDDIVTEFTKFARLPAPNPAPMDLAATVRKVVGLHESSGVEIEIESEPCPSVRADADQMIQVATNLLQNAIYAARQKGDPRVRVEVRPYGDDLVALVVTDNGPGVDRAMRERLFEPYRTNKPEGTGLGLAIVQRIVFEHGGEIVHDEPAGGGARFTMTLPVRGPAMLGDAPLATPRVALPK